MKNITDYASTTADWRKQLKINEHRTYIVICMFIAIYTVIGLLVDLYLHPELGRLTIFAAIKVLVTLQVIPKATLILGSVAIISLFITYSLHDRLILLGTNYYEIKPGSRTLLRNNNCIM